MKVLLTVSGTERDEEITPDRADEIVDMFERDPFYANRYDVVRKWEPVWFIVSVHPKGDPWSVVSMMAPLAD